MHSGPRFNERVPQKRTKKKKLGSVIVIRLHPYFFGQHGPKFSRVGWLTLPWIHTWANANE
jgi:hypothetical protein